MVKEDYRFINYRRYIDGDFMQGYPLQNTLRNEGFLAAAQEVKDFFKRITISTLFIADHPHIIFLPVTLDEVVVPVISITQALELGTSESFQRMDEEQRFDRQLEMLRALVRNYELYQLVRDRRGTLLRWGRTDEEEELAADEILTVGSAWTMGLTSHLKKLAYDRIVTWWSRCDVRDRPHYAGGTVLRTTSLDVIRKTQSHFIGKDIHESTSLVLIKK